MRLIYHTLKIASTGPLTPLRGKSKAGLAAGVQIRRETDPVCMRAAVGKAATEMGCVLRMPGT
jgi:hypothetical protein